MKKVALISVYDKTGIVDFTKELIDLNYKIISTGKTAELLRENKIEVSDIKDITKCEEMLEGKVKTLHPNIFSGILADITQTKELEEINKKNISPISLVVVNLYPFEDVAEKSLEENELIKNIDIGGVSLLRAAAKNNKNVLAVSSINDYPQVIQDLKTHKGSFSNDLSKECAVKAFELTAKYDYIIALTLEKIYDMESQNYRLNVQKISDLRYGENPHQKASVFSNEHIIDYNVLQGKEISYNNLLDATSALNIVSEFYDVPSCAIIKHNQPCGVALGADVYDAYKKALDCDPISAFGGIVAFSQEVTRDLAKELTSLFLEVVIAPNFSKEALDILSKKQNLRIIHLLTPLVKYKEFLSKEVKVTPFGILIQEYDSGELNKDTFKVVSKEKPTSEMIEDMIFAWKVAKHVKSNAIVIAKDFKTLGICGGQTARIDSVEIALNKACDGAKDAVLASDGFFPAIDNINSAAQCRIKGIIQPGGSIKDKDVIAQVDKFGLVMITTGMRHFKH